MQQHGLEFEFDCDSAQCAISLQVVGVPAAVPADPAIQAGSQRLVLFETTVEGGFGRKLHLHEGATLELARLERAAIDAAEEAAAEAEAAAELSRVNSPEASSEVAQQPAANPRKRISIFRRKGTSSSSTTSTLPVASQQQGLPNARPQMTQLPAIPPVTGPALAVVDEQTVAPNAVSVNIASAARDAMSRDRNLKRRDDEESGVKIVIRLSALDANGKALASRNEQTTYLHIVRFGPKPISPPTAVALAADDRSQAEPEIEDTRPWVVKVVKREARVGIIYTTLSATRHLARYSSSDRPAHVSPSRDLRIIVAFIRAYRSCRNSH